MTLLILGRVVLDSHSTNASEMQHNGMEGIKFVGSQAKSIYQYKSLRSKILKYNADIFFNKQCLTKRLIPNFAKIRVPNTSEAAHHTQKKANIIRIKDEIKFLYLKGRVVLDGHSTNASDPVWSLQWLVVFFGEHAVFMLNLIVRGTDNWLLHTQRCHQEDGMVLPQVQHTLPRTSDLTTCCVCFSHVPECKKIEYISWQGNTAESFTF